MARTVSVMPGTTPPSVPSTSSRRHRACSSGAWSRQGRESPPRGPAGRSLPASLPGHILHHAPARAGPARHHRVGDVPGPAIGPPVLVPRIAVGSSGSRPTPRRRSRHPPLISSPPARHEVRLLAPVRCGPWSLNSSHGTPVTQPPATESSPVAAPWSTGRSRTGEYAGTRSRFTSASRMFGSDVRGDLLPNASHRLGGSAAGRSGGAVCSSRAPSARRRGHRRPRAASSLGSVTVGTPAGQLVKNGGQRRRPRRTGWPRAVRVGGPPVVAVDGP